VKALFQPWTNGLLPPGHWGPVGVTGTTGIDEVEEYRGSPTNKLLERSQRASMLCNTKVGYPIYDSSPAAINADDAFAICGGGGASQTGVGNKIDICILGPR